MNMEDRWLDLGTTESGWLRFEEMVPPGRRVLLRNGHLFFPRETVAAFLGADGEIPPGSQDSGQWLDFASFLRAVMHRRGGAAEEMALWAAGAIERFAVDGEIYEEARLKRHAFLREGYGDRLRERVMSVGLPDAVPGPLLKSRLAELFTCARDYSPGSAAAVSFFSCLWAEETAEADLRERYADWYELFLRCAAADRPVDMRDLTDRQTGRGPGRRA